jgi:hypothetical protein
MPVTRSIRSICRLPSAPTVVVVCDTRSPRGSVRARSIGLISQSSAGMAPYCAWVNGKNHPTPSSCVVSTVLVAAPCSSSFWSAAHTAVGKATATAKVMEVKAKTTEVKGEFGALMVVSFPQGAFTSQRRSGLWRGCSPPRGPTIQRRGRGQAWSRTARVILACWSCDRAPEADTGAPVIAESRCERNADGSRDVPPHVEGASAGQELRPCQEATGRQGTAREVGRPWGCRDHQQWAPRQSLRQVSRLLGN